MVCLVIVNHKESIVIVIVVGIDGIFIQIGIYNVSHFCAATLAWRISSILVFDRIDQSFPIGSGGFIHRFGEI